MMQGFPCVTAGSSQATRFFRGYFLSFFKSRRGGMPVAATDNIFAEDVFRSIQGARIVEDYPDFSKGPFVLVLQEDRNKLPIHVVWGIAKGKSAPAVLITAYRPDPDKWNEDFTRRKT